MVIRFFLCFCFSPSSFYLGNNPPNAGLHLPEAIERAFSLSLYFFMCALAVSLKKRKRGAWASPGNLAALAAHPVRTKSSTERSATGPTPSGRCSCSSSNRAEGFSLVFISGQPALFSTAAASADAPLERDQRASSCVLYTPLKCVPLYSTTTTTTVLLISFSGQRFPGNRQRSPDIVREKQGATCIWQSHFRAVWGDGRQMRPRNLRKARVRDKRGKWTEAGECAQH